MQTNGGERFHKKDADLCGLCDPIWPQKLYSWRERPQEDCTGHQSHGAPIGFHPHQQTIMKEEHTVTEMPVCVCVCVCVCVSHSVMSDSATPWTIVHQAPLAMEFSRQEYWSSLPFPSPGDLPNPGIKPGSPALQADSLRSEFIACIFQAQRQTPSAK